MEKSRIIELITSAGGVTSEFNVTTIDQPAPQAKNIEEDAI